MKNLLVLLLMTFLFCACEPEEKQVTFVYDFPENPIFVGNNEPIQFDQITSESIVEAVDVAYQLVDTSIALIAEIENDKRTFHNTMMAMDNMTNGLIKIYTPIYLLGSTHMDSLIRTTAVEKRTEMGKLFNDLQLNEDLYKAVKAYAESPEAKELSGSRSKFVKESVDDFERNGFALAEAERNELKSLLDEISEVGNEFNTNIAQYQDFLILSENEMAGLPDDYKKARKQDDGTYKIGMSYPDVGPFFRLAKSSESRKQLLTKFTNRAAEKNPEVLMRLIEKRTSMAKMLDYETYAGYVLDDRMAKTPKTVWDFEKGLREKVLPKAKEDMNELIAYQKELGVDEDNVNIWDRSYITEKLLTEKYGVDNEKVKEYFELENVKQGLFEITQNLFGLEYKSADVPVWHEDVDAYEVFQDDKMIGRFYLDLHPRPNKYNHAACFPLIQSKQLDNEYQNPSATLVCNFPEATDEKPALMTHGNAETFFHEFGHVLHNLLSKTELASQAGTQVARDFVEAPSQIFENWVWDYESVSLFAKHYKTGEIIPEDLFQKMVDAKNVSSGIFALRQIHYGTYDITLYDGYQFQEGESTTDLWHEMYERNTLFPSIPGTKPEASFGHLNGYAAGYYGYMWSLVYAQDMFSVFDEKGIMNAEVGMQYRDKILSRGSEVDEMEMLVDFLGREPNEDAFVKSLGLE